MRADAPTNEPLEPSRNVTAPRGTQRRQEGSVLLLTLIITGILTMLSMSFGAAVKDQIEIARELQPSFQAEMAAHSAVAFALKQLHLDREWDGTSGGPVHLTEGTEFEVSREPDTSPPVISMTGRHGEAQVVLEMTVAISDSSDILREQALSVLGGSVDFLNVTVDGNVMVTDTLGVCHDYAPDPTDWDNGTWEMGGPGALGAFAFNNVTVENGSLRKFVEADYGIAGEEVTVSQEIHAPSYNMAPYLEPGPNLVHVHGINTAQEVTVDETVVVFLDPGENLRLIDVNLKGGLVVYVDPDYDLREGPLNRIVMKKTSSIGGGSQGVHPNLSILAPASELSSPGCDHSPNLSGVSYVNRVQEFHQAEIFGQLFIHNDAAQLWHTNVHFNESIAQDPPPGFDYFSGANGDVTILEIREVFDPETIPTAL